jgi:putative ABC transport system ATP-binding protein
VTTEAQGHRLEARDWIIGWGGEALVGPVDFTLSAGERVTVTGPSGCGKSTLLRSLAGLLDPMGGSLSLNGQSPEVWGWPTFRGQVQYVGQRAVLGQMTVEAVLKRPFSFSSQQLAYERERAIETLAELGLSAELLERRASTLSEGEQQRLAFARSLLLMPRFILLDEPTSALDDESAALVEQVIERRCSHGGMGVLWVTHDGAQAARVGDRTLPLKGPS